jgi:hypothetical protein
MVCLFPAAPFFLRRGGAAARRAVELLEEFAEHDEMVAAGLARTFVVIAPERAQHGLHRIHQSTLLFVPRMQRSKSTFTRVFTMLRGRSGVAMLSG